MLNKEKRNAFATVKRPLKAQYLLIEAKVLDFVVYARSQRYAIASSHIKEYRLRAAEKSNKTRFRASNGWLRRLLRRSSFQSSFKFQGKGGNALPASTKDKMAVIRDITSTYESQDIYNMDESGLLYRVGPSKTYLNDAWSTVPRETVLKCWVKSQCLGVRHIQCLNSFIQNLTAADDVVDII